MSTVGGVATGVVIAALGQPIRLFVPHDVRLLLFALVVGAFILGVVQGRAITHSGFVVPAEWVTMGGATAGRVWGLILGLGFLTQTGSLFHTYLAGTVLADRWWHGAVGGAAFGIGRAVFPLLPRVRREIICATRQRKGSTSLLGVWARGCSLGVLSLCVALAVAQLVAR